MVVITRVTCPLQCSSHPLFLIFFSFLFFSLSSLFLHLCLSILSSFSFPLPVLPSPSLSSFLSLFASLHLPLKHCTHKLCNAMQQCVLHALMSAHWTWELFLAHCFADEKMGCCIKCFKMNSCLPQSVYFIFLIHRQSLYFLNLVLWGRVLVFNSGWLGLIARLALNSAIFLSQPSECWDHRS